MPLGDGCPPCISIPSCWVMPGGRGSRLCEPCCPAQMALWCTVAAQSAAKGGGLKEKVPQMAGRPACPYRGRPVLVLFCRLQVPCGPTLPPQCRCVISCNARSRVQLFGCRRDYICPFDALESEGGMPRFFVPSLMAAMCSAAPCCGPRTLASKFRTLDARCANEADTYIGCPVV